MAARVPTPCPGAAGLPPGVKLGPLRVDLSSLPAREHLSFIAPRVSPKLPLPRGHLNNKPDEAT